MFFLGVGQGTDAELIVKWLDGVPGPHANHFQRASNQKNTPRKTTGKSLETYLSYEDVCLGETEHVEVVLITFDEKIITYKEIIEHFWLCHDPTQLNRQGPDIGRQYRSAIFYSSEEEKKIALDSKKEKQKLFSKIIETEITMIKKFYIAEEYHQLYILKRNNNA